MFGVAAIVSMVVIGFDRYNVIVKGFTGTRITGAKVGSQLKYQISKLYIKARENYSLN